MGPMESITKRAEVTLDLPKAPPNLMRGKPRDEVKALLKKKGVKASSTAPKVGSDAINTSATSAALARDSPTSDQGNGVALSDRTPQQDEREIPSGPLVVGGHLLGVDDYVDRASAVAEAHVQANIERRQ